MSLSVDSHFLENPFLAFSFVRVFEKSHLLYSKSLMSYFKFPIQVWARLTERMNMSSFTSAIDSATEYILQFPDINSYFVSYRRFYFAYSFKSWPIYL